MNLFFGGGVSTAYCFKNCPYLYGELGYCIRPELNGRGNRLKRENEKYIKECKNKGFSNKDRVKISVLCPKNCEYLNEDFGLCLLGGPKSCRKLKFVGTGFEKICNMEPLEAKSKNKYHAKKVSKNGVVYDSKLELERHEQLKLLERAGKISDLKYHQRFVLVDKNENGREIAYEADFVYKKDGKLVVEDTKSVPTKTRLYQMKKRLMKEKYGIEISEYIG